MKGHIQPDDFLRAILDRETGLRGGHVMSHVFILETVVRGRLTFVTDGAMNIAPDLTTNAAIIMNAVYLARCFGIPRPKVGVLVGASAPVVLTSRADSVEARFYSIAAAVLMANIDRCERMKIGKVHF